MAAAAASVSAAAAAPSTATSTSTPTAGPDIKPRSIRKTFLAREQSEGAGARVRRSIGSIQQRHLTPFLMLDHFRVPFGAGFPDHPHRGQETITYLLEGSLYHEDFAGNKGRLGPGDLQFMTAGRGIVHAEMPGKDSSSDGSGDGPKDNVGLQLWVDLPEKLKSCEPRYRDLRADEIPLATAGTGTGTGTSTGTGADTGNGKVQVKVISGRALGVDSVKDLAYTPVWLLDITIHPGGKLVQDIPQGWTTFAYTLSGLTGFVDSSSSSSNNNNNKETKERVNHVQPYHCVIFEQVGDHIVAQVEDGGNHTSEPARFILVSGQPHDQPIVQYGPFVTTSRDAVIQALQDYHTFANGFERAENWQSEIGKSMM